MLLSYSPVSFHAPFTIDDQIRLFANSSGNHLLNFKLAPDYSNSLLQSVCSYIYEGVPVSKIPSDISGSYNKIYENRILPKELTDSQGNLKNHVWKRAGYQAIYSDLLIENSSLSPIPEGQKLEVFWMALNANYVNIDSNGNITSFSPLINNQLSIWNSLNPGKTPSNKDYFGTSDIVGYGYQTVPLGSEGGVSLALSGMCSVNLVSKKVLFPGNSVPVGVTRVAIYAQDSNIDNPVIGIKTSLDPLDVYIVDELEGAIKLPEEIETNIKTESGPLTGQTKPNWYVGALFPDEVYRYVKANSAGSWSITYPEAYYTEEELDSIIVAESEVYVDENTVFTNEQIQTAYGLPILKLVSSSVPNTMYNESFVNIIQRYSSDYSFSQSALGGYGLFTSETPNFLLSGLYVGRSLNSSDTSFRKKFLSYPGAVIQETGIEVFYSYRQISLEDKTTPSLNSLYAEPLISVSVGMSTYYLKSETFNISYENEFLTTTTERYKFKYEVSFDAKIDIYKIRWERNVDSQAFLERWRLSWESDTSTWKKQEYYFRYEITLPKDRDLKDFYFISWDKESLKTDTTIYKISFETEQSMYKTQSWTMKWDLVLSDRAIIKPYYLQKIENGVLVHCISFQVYVDYAYVENFIANDRLYFYFSNPPKYELIQFDYNMLPYQGIFLEEITDLALDIRDDVPDRYTLLGNYTIKDVNLENSFSLDIMADLNQMNEYRSYWIPEDLENFQTSFILLEDGESKALPLDYKFRDDHHTDIVELDLVILTSKECCFTQKVVGSRCSPY